MIRFCHALHRRIVYTGRLCPLCHEIEVNLELMNEIKNEERGRRAVRTSGE